MRNNNRGYRVVLLTILLAAVVACSGDQPSDLRQFVDELKHMLANSKDKAEDVTLYARRPAVVYTANELRSPFDAPVVGTSKAGVVSTPLQAFPLSVLKFVGVVSQGDTMNAFILAPDGIMYQVKEGDMIGDHYGRIISIQSDKLNVMEQDEVEGTQARQRVVSLQLKDGD